MGRKSFRYVSIIITNVLRLNRSYGRLMLTSNTYNQHFAPLSAEQLAENATKKVICGMSGGVDSSVSAFILQQQGYQVEGLFMKNWEEDDDTDYCTAAADLADAQAVCDKLGIKRHLGANYIATGHYVRRRGAADQAELLRGLDSNKDQSYFLYTLSKNQVGQSLFPVGEIEKPIVRAIAEDLGLITAKKKDSTGICFIGERKFKDFLARYLPAQPGDIRTVDGEIIGRHEGLMYHTLGQRKGLGIGGLKNAGDEAWYVVDKDVENNELIVAQGHDHPRLFSKGLIAKQLHWVNREPVREAFRCTVKTRYRQTDIACLVEPIDDYCIRVIFDEPQAAVTPGQSAVFYLDEVCLGGGIIEERI